MFAHRRAITLVELLIAVALLGLVLLAISSLTQLQYNNLFKYMSQNNVMDDLYYVDKIIGLRVKEAAQINIIDNQHVNLDFNDPVHTESFSADGQQLHYTPDIINPSESRVLTNFLESISFDHSALNNPKILGFSLTLKDKKSDKEFYLRDSIMKRQE